MIYLDNAATSFLKPNTVAQAVFDSFSQVGNAGRGINQASVAAERIVYETRQLLAEMVGATPKQVAFTSGSTESLNTIIHGYLASDDHVITSVMEHNSVLRPLYRLGCDLSFIPIDESGRLDRTGRDLLVKPNTKCLILTHAANLTGVVNDLVEWGQWAKEQGIALIVDASQTMGVLPIDMNAMNIAALAFTGHKGLFGAQGTGGIILADGFDIQPLKVGGSGIATFSKDHPHQMPTRLEAGTLNIHGLAGLRAGLLFIQHTGLDAIHDKEMLLRQRFLEGIKDLDVTLYGAVEDAVGIVALNVAHEDSAVVGDWLSDEGILVRTGGHCAPLHHEAFGTVDQGMVRFSFSYFNPEVDIDKAIVALRNIF